jgi:hypothetical protein
MHDDLFLFLKNNHQNWYCSPPKPIRLLFLKNHHKREDWSSKTMRYIVLENPGDWSANSVSSENLDLHQSDV